MQPRPPPHSAEHASDVRDVGDGIDGHQPSETTMDGRIQQMSGITGRDEARSGAGAILATTREVR